jgi:response regulator of citrate/malate metabolism
MRTIRTLVVDDDFRVAAVHAAYAAKVDGFETIGQVHSATEALTAARELQPDLVLMDVFLPDGDGLSVVRRLLESDPHPDVIVITAARDMATVRTAMQLGAIHYLVKPFGFAALSDRLNAYRKLRVRMEAFPPEGDQIDVDELFGMMHGRPSVGRVLEKGHSAATMELVRNAVRAAPGAVSAADVGESVGISRATAQRYLSYLERHGVVRLQLRYGTNGRPENRYAAI